MKAKIDSGGNLSIKRNGGFHEQFCPFSPATEEGTDPMCGDWCPMFEDDQESNSAHLNCGGGIVTLSIEEDKRQKKTQ